ncbi:MAG: hypothetical protein Q8Q32_00720 [bacterium]|nr:hypothetical protein [bacterium]
MGNLKPITYNLFTRSEGTSLIEVLLAMAIFVILSLSIFFTYGNILEIVGRSEHTMLATTLLNREIEIIRNLEYEDIGVQNGYPPGVIPQQITKNFQGVDFQIYAFVRNIDNPFDGTVTSTPSDTAPADYKLVELRAECEVCINYRPLSVTTYLAPANLENASENGSLFIAVFDANGQPVSGADIVVENNALSPAIEISDTTGVNGMLQLVDLPTSTSAYEITVSKTGYTGAQTYEIGDSDNPNPTKPHATIASQELTSISFTIDKVSSLNITTASPFCSSLADIDLQMDGSKLIGASPNVLKFSETISTDENGDYSKNNLEWDTYIFNSSSSAYQIFGTTPPTPLVVNPSETANLDFVLVPSASTTLLVKVINTSGSSAISNANVKIEKGSTVFQKETERWIFGDTDWSGGNYSSQPDGNIDDSNPAGSLTLVESAGTYATGTNSVLTSNTFDLGTSSTDISWISILPDSGAAGTEVKLQIASNNDNSSWTFVGPNNSTSTFYDPTASTTVHSSHNGDRYFRYQLTLNTDDADETPSAEEIYFEFNSPCLPIGHALFQNLETGDYNITVTASGYILATSTVNVSTGFVEEIIEMDQ